VADYSDLSYALAGYGRKASPYDQRRKQGYSLLQQGMDTSPILSPWQGVGRLAQALVGGMELNAADSEEKAADKKRSDALAQAMAEPDPQKRIGLLAAYDPDKGAMAAGQLAVEQAKLQQQQTMLANGANSFGGSFNQPGGTAPQTASTAPLPQGAIAPGGFANNVGNIRATNINWDGKGAPQNGFETFATPQAGANAMFKNLGAYVQANPTMTVAQAIAKWAPPTENNTQAYIQRLSEATGINPGMPLGEVLKDPAAAATLMDGIARIEKGGLPQGFSADTFMQAASPPPMAGTQPVQQGGGDMTGMPPAPNPAQVNGPTLTAPQVPDVPRPQPTTHQLQQYQQRIRSGEFGLGPDAISKARAALDADLDRQWAVDRDRAKMAFEQQNSSYARREAQEIQQPQQTIGNESQLRNQFDNLQPVKDYRKAATIFDNAVKSYKTNTAAADLNLVYSFATMMDPGSVVREGEMGMVRATQNASDQVKALVAAVSGGARLSPDARENLMQQMANRYGSYKQVHDQLAESFGGIADRSGMNRQNIVAPLPEVKFEPASKNKGGVVPPQPAIDRLRTNPQEAAQFDEIFGQGAAARVLGR
jgi:hypothetical protein